MVFGIAAGITWALETVLLGAALQKMLGIIDPQKAALAPFISTFLHDLCSALLVTLFNGVRGEWKKVFALLRSRQGLYIVLAALIGGPVGMTGYVLAINNLGPSIGAVASAVYPAVGAVLAYFFLKEKMQWYRWVFLLFALAGVYGVSASPGAVNGSFLLGAAGALACSLGWGTEAVILAKCMRSADVKQDHILQIRQTVSAITYGAVILPLSGGWKSAAEVIASGRPLPLLAGAALCASVSYLCYYRSISKIGASKSMALNITYAAWAMVFSLLIFGDKAVLNPLCAASAVVVIVCGILAAADFKSLIRKIK